MDDELMTIGHFARLTGLSVDALRHYDEVSLLVPTSVDPASGYRRYRRDQATRARCIRMLRCADLPIEEIRKVIDDETGAVVGHVLTAHRRRLERQRDLLTASIRNAERYIEKGIPMTDVRPGCWPVQIKIAVEDVDAAVEFYVKAFGLSYNVVQRTEHGDYSAFMFGTYGQDDFFLLHLIAGQEHMDRPGQSTFGLLVDDVDDRHSLAVAQGATEVVPPGESEGMPRRSAVRDPSGNWIWLYQA